MTRTLLWFRSSMSHQVVSSANQSEATQECKCLHLTSEVMGGNCSGEKINLKWKGGRKNVRNLKLCSFCINKAINAYLLVRLVIYDVFPYSITFFRWKPGVSKCFQMSYKTHIWYMEYLWGSVLRELKYFYLSFWFGYHLSLQACWNILRLLDQNLHLWT